MSNFGLPRRENRCGTACATFGYAPQAVNTIAAGGFIPYNVVVENLSKRCCDHDIKLNVGSGDIFIREAGKYQIAVRLDVPSVADTYIEVTTGNGATARASIYSLAGEMVFDLFVKRDSVVKVVVGGTGPIVFTPGTDTSIPMSVIAITKLEA